MVISKPILKLIFSCCFIACYSCSARSQQKLFDLPAAVGEVEICVFDLFENAYILTDKNALVKVSPNGIEAEYQVPFGYGIDQLGMNHIHKLYIFSEDQQTIILLDNQLTELSTISFNDLGYHNVTSVDLSEEDRLWFIDADRRQLIEFPANNAVLSTSFAIREVNQNLIDFEIDESVDRISIIGNECSYSYSLTGQYLSYTEHGLGTIIDDKGLAYIIKDNKLWKVERLMPSDVKIVDLPDDVEFWNHIAIKQNSLYYLYNKGCYKISLTSN